MDSQNRNWIYLREFKPLPHALSLQLDDSSTTNMPFKTYTQSSAHYFRNYPRYLYSLLVVQLTIPSRNNTIRNKAYAYPLIDKLTSVFMRLSSYWW